MTLKIFMVRLLIQSYVLQLTNYLGCDGYHNLFVAGYPYMGVGWMFRHGNESGIFGDSDCSDSYRDSYTSSQC